MGSGIVLMFFLGSIRCDKNEVKEIQMFSSHLEVTLNQLYSYFPTLTPEGDMDNQLKNQLFYGMHKTL